MESSKTNNILCAATILAALGLLMAAAVVGAAWLARMRRRASIQVLACSSGYWLIRASARASCVARRFQWPQVGGTASDESSPA